MDKTEHGRRLREAVAAAGLSREDVATAVDASTRTVTNWTSGRTMPDPKDRAKLRRIFPGYDEAGDAVELAVRRSALTEDRQYALLGTYKRLLREQDEDAAARPA